MTRTEIIEELRRSVREDADPAWGCADHAYIDAHRRGANLRECALFLTPDDCRTAYLLVAHALEDEC